MGKAFRAVAAATGLLVFYAGTAVASGQSGSDACRGPHYVETYRVTIAPLSEKVRRGAVAKVVATVYRTADDAPVAPAEGANVMVALRIGDYVRAGGAVTDGDGRAVVRVPLRGGFPTGWADATGRATRAPAEDLPCDPVQEAGSTNVERFLRVL